MTCAIRATKRQGFSHKKAHKAQKEAVLVYSKSSCAFCGFLWLHPGTRMQATWWPGATSRNSGSMCAHSSMAIGQRVRKRQPDGGLIGVGTSPCKMIRLRFCFGSGTGIADSNACVYG